ncbi:MAG TPA: UvrD-helicase domain-containing protein, partial [Anaerolineales bacterium]|nr:UvrD-helicase domain-containing protein [Anaerolineales bacterium]
MPDLLSGLNPQQHKAVTAGSGPTLVVAGPGSGKTRVLTHRIAYLVQQGTPPFRIMAVTFTNKAAREMRERVEHLLGGALGGLTIGTFHAICARFLRREADRLDVTRDFVIFDDSDQLAVVKQAMERLKLDD